MSTSDDVVTQYSSAGEPVDELIDWDADPLAILIAREEAETQTYSL